MGDGMNTDEFSQISTMIFSHLRLRINDHWPPIAVPVKLASLLSAFPGLTKNQYLYAAEKWIQANPDASGKYKAFPTWRELMVPLFNTGMNNGLAYYHLGTRDGVPDPLRVDPAPQLAPATPVNPAPANPDFLKFWNQHLTNRPSPCNQSLEN